MVLHIKSGTDGADNLFGVNNVFDTDDKFMALMLYSELCDADAIF